MLEYFPATVPTSWDREPFLFKKNKFFKYNRGLVSYANRGKTDFIACRDKDVLMMGDSGGFQRIGNPNLRISPLDVVGWQNDQCDIGITLDRPPVIDNRTYDKINFDKFMIESCRDANIMMANRREGGEGDGRGKLKLFVAIHGYNNETRRRWLDNTLKEYDDWDAYAIAARPLGDPFVLIDWLMFAKNNGLKNIHVLARAGRNSLHIMTYMQKHFKRFTFDSSNVTLAMTQRSYFLPYFVDAGKIRISEDAGFGNMPCTCPCCREISVNGGKGAYTASDISHFMTMHNIITMVRYIKYLDSLKNRDEFPIRRDIKDYIDNYDSGIQKTVENAWDDD